jgi:hypothetical protein
MRMTPAELRAICASINDECGTGGQTKLARSLRSHHSTVWRKLNGKSTITKSDEVAIRQAVRSHPKLPGNRPVGGKLAEKHMCKKEKGLMPFDVSPFLTIPKTGLEPARAF